MKFNLRWSILQWLGAWAILCGSLRAADSVIYYNEGPDIAQKVPGQPRSLFYDSTNSQLVQGLLRLPSGELLVAHNGEFIRRYSPSGVLLGNFASGMSVVRYLVRDSAGNIFAYDLGSRTIRKFSPGGGIAGTVVATVGVNPGPFVIAIAIDQSDNLYASVTADSSGVNRVRKYTRNSNGSYSETLNIALEGNYSGQGVVVDGDGYIWIAQERALKKFSAAGVFLNSYVVDDVRYVSGLAADGDGNFLLAMRAFGEPIPNLIYKVSPTGENLGVVADTGAVAVDQMVSVPFVKELSAAALTVGAAAGSESVMLKLSPPSVPWTASSDVPWLQPAASGKGSAVVGFSFDANPGVTRTGVLTIAGDAFTVTQAGSTYVAANPLTALASTGLNYPFTVAVDHAGNV